MALAPTASSLGGSNSCQILTLRILGDENRTLEQGSPEMHDEQINAVHPISVPFIPPQGLGAHQKGHVGLILIHKRLNIIKDKLLRMLRLKRESLYKTQMIRFI